MKTTHNFDGINKYSKRQKKHTLATLLFGYLATIFCVIALTYILFNVGNQRIEQYCEIHKGEGRLDCIFSKNF